MRVSPWSQQEVKEGLCGPALVLEVEIPSFSWMVANFLVSMKSTL